MCDTVVAGWGRLQRKHPTHLFSCCASSSTAALQPPLLLLPVSPEPPLLLPLLLPLPPAPTPGLCCVSRRARDAL
jgi:hypothetical protein